MSSSLPVAIGVLAAALAVAFVVGRLLTRRDGVLRNTEGAAVGPDVPGSNCP